MMKPISTSALQIGAKCLGLLPFGELGVEEVEGMGNYSKNYLKSEEEST
jgi:hypothetical protein